MFQENKAFVLNDYIGAECTNFKPMEMISSTRMNLIKRLNAISGIQASIVNEMGNLLLNREAPEASLL